MKWRSWLLIPILGLIGRLGKADMQMGTGKKKYKSIDIIFNCRMLKLPYSCGSTAQNRRCFTLSSPPTTHTTAAISCQQILFHRLSLYPDIQKHSSLLASAQLIVDRLCIPNSPATVKICKYVESSHIKIEKTLAYHVNKRQGSSGYKVILSKRSSETQVNAEDKSNSRAYAKPKYHVSGRKDRRKNKQKRREKGRYANRSTIEGKSCFF